MCVFTDGRSSDEVSSNKELSVFKEKIEQELFSYEEKIDTTNWEISSDSNPDISKILKTINDNYDSQVQTRLMFLDTLKKVKTIRNTAVAHQDGNHVNPSFEYTESGSRYVHACQMLDIDIALNLLFIIPRMKIMVNEFISNQNSN